MGDVKDKIMDNKNQSLFNRLNPKNYKFGVKLNILTFSLILISTAIISTISILHFEDFMEQTNKINLEVTAINKKTSVEYIYNDMLKNLPGLITTETAENIINLSKSYSNHFSQNDKMESSGAIKLYTEILSEFYKDEVIDEITWNKPELELIQPKNPNQISLQNEYLVNNKNDWGEKYKLLKADDNTEYSVNHINVHTKIKSAIKKYNFNNAYLIDKKTGVIFYNYNKNIALGENIFEGYLKQSKLALLFHQVLASDKNALFVSDFEYFIPEFNQPVAFIGIPVLQYGQKVSVLIFEINSTFYEKILNPDENTTILTKNGKTFPKESISYNLIGLDNKLRTNDQKLLNHKIKYFERFSRLSSRNPQFKNAAQSGSAVLSLGIKKPINKLEADFIIGKNHLGEESYIYSIPISLNNLPYNLIVHQVVSSDNTSLLKIRIYLLIACIFIIIFGVYITYVFRNSIVKRLAILKNLMKVVVKGEIVTRQEIIWKDELGETISVFFDLKDRVAEASDYALELSNGHFDKEFKAISENDDFAKSLNTLKERLLSNKLEEENRAKEDTIRNWTNEGIARFNDLLRQSNNDINNLAYIIIKNLIEYLEANQGGIFLVEGEHDSVKTIHLISTFAYNRRKFNKKEIQIGEGLIGNCYLEKKPIHLSNIPEDYVEITSGLGEASPKELYISPLIMDSEILGFIEIASFNNFSDYQIEFINKISENIAATFSTVKLNTKTALLLEESKRRANEIAQQEEEMRQNLEEMQATQEELARLRDEDEQRTRNLQFEIDNTKSLLQQLINSMDGEVLLKNSEGIIILANEEAAQRFNSTPEKLKGKSNFDIYTPDKAAKIHEIDQIALKEGIYTEENVELVGNTEQKYFIIKKQFYLPGIKETGVITIRNKR